MESHRMRGRWCERSRGRAGEVGEVGRPREGRRARRRRKSTKLTESKFTRIEPTFVAPTGIIEKKPYRQRPRRATRSLRTKRSASLPTIQGETEKSSPARSREHSQQHAEDGGRRKREERRTNQQSDDDVRRPKPSASGTDGNLPAQGKPPQSKACSPPSARTRSSQSPSQRPRRPTRTASDRRGDGSAPCRSRSRP